MIKLTTLGSGTFFVDKQVSASSFLLEHNQTKILIDCGPGTLVKLSQAGINLEAIDYVFITHLHPDHTSDLFPLFMNFRLNDVFNPEPVTKFPTFYGPSVLEKYMLDYSHLTQLHGFENWGKIEIKSFETEFIIDTMKISTFKAIHKPFGVDTEGYCLRFELDGKIISFSGDTADCEGVREASKDADLFICDCSFPKSRSKDEVHMNTTEIGEIARDSNVKEVLLDHFYPQFSEIDLVAEVKEEYSGKVRKSNDLEVIELN
jgi:ribonuclease BN (tRNA processing enzyme)